MVFSEIRDEAGAHGLLGVRLDYAILLINALVNASSSSWFIFKAGETQNGFASRSAEGKNGTEK